MRALKITKSITRREQRSLEKYLNDISKYDVLTADEEYNLFLEFRNGCEKALDGIVRHNLRFVVSVAKKYQNMGLSLSDLINEGNLGLIKAARRFDVTRGFKFISYAVWWIRQSILQALNDRGRNIRLPSNVQHATTAVNREMAAIYQREERLATVDELAEATGLPPNSIERSMKYYRRTQSLDAPIQSDSSATLGQMLPDRHTRLPDHGLAVTETHRIEIRRLLNTLPERQADILALFFGIGRKYPMTLGDIGEKMDLSKERVRQIRDRALARLRLRAERNRAAFAAA